VWGGGSLVANFDNNAKVQNTPEFAERFYNGDAPLTTEEGVSVSYENLKLRATNMRAIGIEPDETLKAMRECQPLG